MSGNRSGPPDVCTAAVFEASGRPFVLREFPVPSPRDGEAIVRIDCCTICGSDLHTVTGARSEPTPSILGHEIVGTVADVAAMPLCDVDAQPLRVGDRVTWSVCVSCGSCDRCDRGMPQKCRSLAKYGHAIAEGRTALSGGLAEYVLLRKDSAVVKLNAATPDEVICPVNCATATVAAAIRTAGRLSDQRVLIFGAGLLGLTAAAFAKSHNAARVVVCDQNTERLHRATQFGADNTVHWDSDADAFRRRLAEDGTGLFDVILELCGSPDAVEATCDVADIGAQIVLVGTVMDTRRVNLDPQRIVRQCLSVHGVHNYAPEDLRTAVRFLERSHTAFPFAEQVEHTWPLADINKAVQAAIRDKPVRVAVHPGG